MSEAPFFSIITPTIQRQSLVKTCRSVEAQTYESWEHIIIVDCIETDLKLKDMIASPPRRTIMQCTYPHHNSGNTCRHGAWYEARGRYLLYLDDDNYLTDKHVLEEIRASLLWRKLPKVAFFPILRMGTIFMPEGRPRRCHVDTANLVVAREVGQWPDIPEYTADGIFVEDLVANYPYASIAGANPIVVMPVISGGK